jgi:hypothetical protein
MTIVWIPRTLLMALSATAIAMPLSAGAEDRYISGLHLELERVRQRIEQFGNARKESPEIFDAVEPYRKPVEFRSNTRDCRLRQIMRPLGLEVLHPDYAAAVKKHSEAYEKIVEICRRWEHDTWLSREEKQRDRDEILALADEYQIPPEDFRLLLGTRGHRAPLDIGHVQRLDPKYELAWEEALIRPGSWRLRRQLMSIVSRFEDPACAPIFGEVLRFAPRDETTVRAMSKASGGSAREQYQDEYIAILSSPARAVEYLHAWPCREALVELSDTIRLTEGDQKERARIIIGGCFVDQPIYDKPPKGAWDKLLTELENDKDYAEHVKVIRDAIEVYKQKKK